MFISLVREGSADIVQDDLYAPYLGQLAKLAFLASALHQTVFTILSTLPFAVGQVCQFTCLK